MLEISCGSLCMKSFKILWPGQFLLQFHYKQEGSYSIGTLGFVDEDCDFIDFTYVSLSYFHCHITSGLGVTPGNRIDKPLVVYRFSYVS